MKKFVLAAVALSMAGIAAPSVASAADHHHHMSRHHHRHCHFVKKKVRVHHHWVWRNVKVCR
jgi:hypothetical protein